MRMPGVEWERRADSANGEGDGRGTGFGGRERETEKGERGKPHIEEVEEREAEGKVERGARETKRIKGKRW